jgi:hypothetical protein
MNPHSNTAADRIGSAPQGQRLQTIIRKCRPLTARQCIATTRSGMATIETSCAQKRVKRGELSVDQLVPPGRESSAPRVLGRDCAEAVLSCGF